MGAQPAALQETVYDEPQPLAPGIEVARARGASGLGEVVLWIRAEPGRTLPLDAPLPAVEVLVLAGGFGADGVRFGPGDFLCLAAGPLRDAVSDGEQGCVCLATCEDTAGLLDD
jgi:anti-sigma factor ChrR (cupin superfamily)